MKNTKNRKIIFTVLFIILLLAIFYFFGKNSKFIQNQKSSQNNESTLPIVQSETLPVKPVENSQNPSLIFSKQEGDNITVYSYNLNSKETKKIFSDKDEKYKIKKIGNMPDDGQNFLVVLGEKIEADQGTIYLISTDEKGTKKKLTENITTTSAPAISQDGSKLAQIGFSNAEIDYGFTIYTSKLDGSEKTKIIKSESNISFLVFSPDNSKIAFVKNTSKGSEINVVDLDKKSSQTVLSANTEQISQLNWTKGNFTFIKSPTKNPSTSSEVYTCQENGKNLKKITVNKQSESYPQYLPDGSNIVYVIQNSDKKSSQIVQADLTGKNVQNLTDGDIIIGWRP